MNIEEVKYVLESQGRSVIDSRSPGYYTVDGKQRSERSLIREVKSIIKQRKKARRGDNALVKYVEDNNLHVYGMKIIVTDTMVTSC